MSIEIKLIKGYCDFLGKNHSIEATYEKIYMSRKLTPGLKLMSFSCDNVDKCKCYNDCCLLALARASQ